MTRVGLSQVRCVVVVIVIVSVHVCLQSWLISHYCTEKVVNYMYGVDVLVTVRAS